MTRTRILGVVLAVVLALVGAVALTGYVGTADARAMAGAKPVPAYVAKMQIPAHTAGEKVAQYLEVKQIPAAAAVAGRVTSLSQLKGLRSNAAIEPGEQLVTARWSSPAKQAAAAATFTMRPDMEAVTVALPVEQAVGGSLQAGDVVGVVIASTDVTNKVDLATQKLHHVQVLKVQPGASLPSTAKGNQGASANPVDTEMVTLALETDGATQLVWGQKFGTVWLTLEQRGTDKETNSTVQGGSCTAAGARCTPVHGGASIDAAY